MQDRQSDQKKSASVAQNAAGFTVGASPFNPVKLELGIILILGVVLFVIHDVWITVWWGQVAVLLSYSLTAALWLIKRTRQISAQIQAASQQPNERES